MCFDHDALPPELPADVVLPPIAGAAGAELLELTSADGARFSAALGQAPSPTGAAVLLLPDVRGLYGFYSVLAERFAQAGHHAIAMDYFGRTAGLGPRDEDFPGREHVPQLTLAQIHLDGAAAIAALRERTGHTGPVVSVGFCFGGTQSFLTTINRDLDIEGAIGFYAGLNRERLTANGMPWPPAVADQMEGPLLGLFGGADPNIPVEDVNGFDDALTAAGVEHEFVVYPGAPHSFFDRKSADFADACEDAWKRVLAFLAQPVGAAA